jgi:hypothetical protein
MLYDALNHPTTGSTANENTTSYTYNASVEFHGFLDGFPSKEIYVDSGNGYNTLYSNYEGDGSLAILKLGPFLGDELVSGSYKNKR